MTAPAEGQGLQGRLSGLTQLPASVGRYLVLEQLGFGGASVVVSALDPLVEREVAIKLLRRGEGQPRFAREGRILAKLDHPHILRLYDVGTTEDGVHYLVTELIQDGEQLRAEGRSVTRVLELCADVADACWHAHQHGIVHCDLKPSNLLTSGERVVVCDFGISKADLEATITRDGLLGTVHYMAPEQLAGRRDDPRIGQFSLGVILFELLAGPLPTEGLPLPAILTQRAAGFAGELHDIRRRSPRLADLIRRATALDPAERFPSMAELRVELGRVIDELALLKPPRRAWSAGRTAGLALGALCLVLSAWLVRRPAGTGGLEALERGVRHAQEGHLVLAIEDYGQVHEAAPELGLALALRGDCRRQLARNAEARSDYEAALALGLPNEVQARVARALETLSGGSPPSAADGAQETLTPADPPEVPPEVDPDTLRRAVGEMEAGQFWRAVPLLNEVLASNPAHGTALTNRGVCRYMQGTYADALEDFDGAVEQGVDDVRIPHFQGLCHAALGELDAAAEAFRRALAQNPEHAPSWGGLGAVEADRGDHSAAVAAYDRALALAPRSGMLEASRALSCERLGRRAEALAGIERALALGVPEDMQAGLLAERRRLSRE